MFQKSQDEEYIKLIIKRMEDPNLLTWVSQTIKIIEPHIIEKTVINDIGCQNGQFYKGLINLKNNIVYNGYDIESLYLELFRTHFKNNVYNLFNIDFEKEKLLECDISVISATLEHCDNEKVLNNILNSTRKISIIRTFLGENYKSNTRKKANAITTYKIQQFSFEEICAEIDKYGFNCKIIRDEHTDSIPQIIDIDVNGQSIIRTQYIIVCERKHVA